MMGKLRKMSKAYCLRQIVACLLVYCILLAVPAQVVQANPDPPDFVGPSVGDYYSPTGTANTVGNTTTITAPNNGTVFDWENFDIGFGHTVEHLMQPSHAVLHRINVAPRPGGGLWGDGDATGINGRLDAPGYLFIVNPMGIVVGSEAWITANRFVASGLNISNFTDFINGVTNELQFDGYDPATLGVQLMAGGEIDASAVALVGKTVINNGTITSGSVVLAAGERVYLAITEGSGNLVVDVTELSTPDPIIDHSVYNAGTIDATDGNVLLAAGDVYSNAISGVANLAAKANRDIMLYDNIQAGEIGMEAGRDIILAVDKTMDSGGMLTLEADRDISLRGRVEAGGAGDVSLTTTSGNVELTDVRAVGNQITINSGGAITEYPSGGDSGYDLTAATLSLSANSGIIGGSPIETSATNITASTVAGNIEIDNNNGFATTADLAVTTGAGNILFSQDGDGSLDVTSATTADGRIEIYVDNAALTAQTVTAGGIDVDDNVSLTTTNSGDVIVDDIKALGNTITINSRGAIREYGNYDSAADLTASNLLLTANNGIGWTGSNYIETAANTIIARTDDDTKTSAHIRLINDNSSPTSLTASTVGTDSWVRFSQRGGGELTLTDVSTDNGSIVIEAKEGDIVAMQVNAGGQFGDVYLDTYDSSGDIAVGSVTAVGNQITINSAGAITEYGNDPEADLTADTLDLTANDRIVYMETAANTIFARTIDDTKTAANIRLYNENSSPTSLTASTVGTNSIIDFSQRGGGKLTLTDVSTDDGSIDISAYSGDIAATLVNAGGTDWDYVSLATNNSGDITVGSVTAADYVYMGSAGSINDAEDDKTVDIVTPYISWLEARDEIGGSPTAGKTDDTLGAIETDVDLLYAYSWGTGGEGGGGDIVIVETDDVELWDVVAESGSIYLEATNGGMTHVIPGEGTYTIKAGASTLTMVQQDDLDLAGFTFENQANTDLMVEITDGGFTTVDTANGGNDENAADQWQSIQAVATDNIVLQGSDDEEDIKIGLHEGFEPITHPFGGVVESSGGGVSIISDKNTVRTAGDTILDNVVISGYSSQADDVGVGLPLDPDRKAAIVVISKEDLKFGPDAELLAAGTYYTTSEEFDISGIEDEGAFDDYLASLESKFGVSVLEKLKQDFLEYFGFTEEDIEDIEFPELKELLEEYLDSIGGLTLVADDREGVGFLDVRDEMPEGYPRYEGDPFDAAIYLASTEGDVDVSSAVSITSTSYEMGEYPNGENGRYGEPMVSNVGAMVIDAFDTVTFDESGIEGGAFEDSLKAGVVGDRLEVVSRITEWLFQADGRLPYPSYPYYGGGPFPLDYTYVLRGAGLENPAIANVTEGIGRAWVLVDPDNAPLDQEAGEKAQQQTLGLDGCPVLVAAASVELGVPSDTIEVSMANSYALNTDIQPCESCARLVNAAAILRDEDGSVMAAMNQVFNELAPANVAYTPEVAASIVTAFAGRVNDGTQYATVIEFIDALVRYIAVLDNEMGSPVGDSVAYAIEKYGQGITDSENNNMAAFIAARLESGETFAQ